MGEALGRGDGLAVQSYKEMRAQLRELSAAKMDFATAHLLTHWDMCAGESGQGDTDTDKDKICRQRGGIRLGIWCNLTLKAFRMRTIDFPEASMSTDVPRPLSTARVALRNLFLPYCHIPKDNLAEGQSSSAGDDGGTRWMVLGGIFALELLAMPPGVKRMAGWLFRPVGELATRIARQTYPLDGGNAAMAPALRAQFTLPTGVLLPEKPAVCAWDSAANAWTDDGIGEVDWHRERRLVRLHTQRIGLLAVVQERTIDLPYKSWRLRPVYNIADQELEVGPEGDGDAQALYSDEPEISLELVTPRLSLDIRVRGSQCWLEGPSIAEFAALQGRRMAPGCLVLELRKAGVAVAPSTEDVAAVGLQGIEAVLEQSACCQVADVCAAFELRSSRWNGTMGTQRCVAQIRESSAFAGGNDDTLDIIDFDTALIEMDEASDTAAYAPAAGFVPPPAAKCSILKSQESIFPAKGALDTTALGDAHVKLLECLRSTAAPEAVARASAAGSAFRATVAQLLRLLRPLSCQ
eukprot:TRINITY_DN1611_c0_g1_i2.p1 TRINITY_DN1611_c0_g1~~TRINITY_DN1611_c0_g1_i2.p1  ORF type:complete len:522 (+),score=108.38 TRINITY_DN1611_c0_g1_i2:1237-2802(+)